MLRPLNLFEVVIGSLFLLIFGFSIVGLNQTFISVDTHILVFGYVMITIGLVYPLLTAWMIIMSMHEEKPKVDESQLEFHNDGRISISLNNVESSKDKFEE
ncbi:MAG: hypothetical protein CMB48_04135 [Euryarchaeota archaeon]|nr:hypothetical protein [Euryarchaeota archaeon]